MRHAASVRYPILISNIIFAGKIQNRCNAVFKFT